MNQSIPPHDKLHSPLPAPQFSLKLLFLMLSLVAVLAAAFHYFRGTGLAVVGLVFAVVGAHVLGNSLGVRLRDSASPISKRLVSVRIQFARTTSLSIRRRQGHVTLLASLGVGLLVAGCGAALFSFVYGARISLLVIAVGAFAFFILGALAGYIVISFVGEILHTVTDATKDD